MIFAFKGFFQSDISWNVALIKNSVNIYITKTVQALQKAPANLPTCMTRPKKSLQVNR